MKHLCSLIITVSLLITALLTPSPVLAASHTLEWQDIDKPGDQDDNLVVSPSEISEMAVGPDDVIYIIDSENARFYRSLDAGETWVDMTDDLDDEGVPLPVSHIAVAPDAAGVVAVVAADGSEVHLSTDGGENWRKVGTLALTDPIQAIAVSQGFTYDGDDCWDIAIGTATWDDGDTTGQVLVYRYGTSPFSWVELTEAGFYLDTAAIAFSPDYAEDKTILVVAADATATRLHIYQSNIWNDVDDASYPALIAGAGYGTGITGIYATIALPSNYSGEEAESRQLFVSLDLEPDDAGEIDDVYRLNDTTSLRLDVAGGDNVNIASIAFDGTLDSGRLLAGAVEPISGSLTVQVWQTEEPWESDPSWEESSIPPTGPGNARVAWSPNGEMAYCGTGQVPGDQYDESAFSASLDGDKWRQMGIVDTVIALADIAVAPDGQSLFAATSSEYGPEGIWRTAGSNLGNHWERLLTMDTASDTITLRLSPNYEDDHTMYAVEIGGDLMAVTHNRGNSWSWVEGYTPSSIIDLAVVDEETLFIALPGGYVRKSVNEALTWRRAVETGLAEINMLTVVDADTLLVGGQNGDVAYSTDGGEEFIQIIEAIGDGTGNVQVAADVDFAENGIIYAATDTPDTGIWRWIIGESDEWEQLDESLTGLADGQSIGGLAVGPEGTLYALRTEPATDDSGGVARSLNPLEADPAEAEFDLVNYELPDGATFDSATVFSQTLPYLKISGDDDQNELWTIDTANQAIYRLQDTLCKAGPTAASPGAEDTLAVDASGFISRLTLKWEELEGADEYEAVIYQDAAAVYEVWTGTTGGVLLNATSGDDSARLLSGQTYSWRVRAIAPVKSPWSELLIINPALSSGEWTPFTGGVPETPANGATNVPLEPTFAWNAADWATGYEFVLARDAAFTDLVISKTGADALSTTVYQCEQTLSEATTYFWKVRSISNTSDSEWATAVFTTVAAAAETPAAPATATPAPEPATPYYVYVIIGIGVLLVAAMVVLILRTGRI